MPNPSQPIHGRLALHNAMWPGLVGKGVPGAEPALGLERMLDLTAAARVDGRPFDGVDLFLYEPHIAVGLSEAALAALADGIAARGFAVGSVVAPVWPSAMGGSAMGDAESRGKFLAAVREACRIAAVFNARGVRRYGVIRIDSADTPAAWAVDPVRSTARIAATFREAARIAEDHGERLAAEGEICWAGMHSWRAMRDLLEAVERPGVVGFQADLAHTYLYLLGYNAPADALLRNPYAEDEFWAAYATMTAALAPWTLDFHVAQSNGTVFGSGAHDVTGRHCQADAPDGRLDLARCARLWLLDERGAVRNGIRHLCWDGCMFPNAVLENPATWNAVLRAMQGVQAALVSPGTPATARHP